jgi:hypothetical protein
MRQAASRRGNQKQEQRTNTRDKKTRHTGFAIIYRTFYRNLFPYPVCIDITVLLAVDR